MTEDQGMLASLETSSEHEGDSGVESTHSGDAVVYIRISVPELNVQRCLQFNQDDTVWIAKQQVLSTLAKDLTDGLNYGLFCPPVNGRAGKFLDEERLLKDYALPGPIGYLEFKYKRRIYKQAQTNQRKMKQLHNKTNLKLFLDAIRRCDVEKVTKYLGKGLDPNFQDLDTGETPMTCAVTTNRCRQMLLALVDGGALIDFRSRGSLTPMHVAARIGNSEAVKTLLDLGAGVNYHDQHGLTPLYYSVCHSTDGTCVNQLLYNYAVIGVTDSAGWTELHQACKNGHVQHVEQLLFYGSDLNAINAGGNTPLHICAVNNQEECARMLLFRGADRNIKNYASQTAAEVAIIASNSQLADIIVGFNECDVVPIQELPSYNEKRRSRMFLASTVISNLQRCRSNPQLHFTREVSNRNGGSGLSLSVAGFQNGSATVRRSNLRPHQAHSLGSDDNAGDAQRCDSDSLRSMSVCSAASVNEVDGVFREHPLASVYRTSSIPRTIVLPKTNSGFGFVLRGAKSGMSASRMSLDFQPTAEFPGLQYIEHVEPDSCAWKAGLLAGDFILEINGLSVVRASHDYAVQLIRDTTDVLVLKVLTITSPPFYDDNPLQGIWSQAAENNDAVNKSPMIHGHQRPVAAPYHSIEQLANHGSLARFGSVPCLPTITARRSLNHFGAQSLRGYRVSSPLETVYAMPYFANNMDIYEEKEDTPPPLPPPPDFYTSDVVPINTNIQRTYANVSDAVVARTSVEIESSFRPGTSAHLPQDSVTRSDTRVNGSDVSSGIPDTQPRNHVPEHHYADANVSSRQPLTPDFTKTTPGQTSTYAALLPGETDQPSQPPPPPPPPLPPSHWTSHQNDPRSTGPRLDPPVPPLSVVHLNVPPVGKKPEPTAADDKGGADTVHASAIRQAVAMRREFVENADMRRVAETIDQRVQRSRPLSRVIYRADRTKETIGDAAAVTGRPAKVVEERPKMSAIQERSTSADGRIGDALVNGGHSGVGNDDDRAADAERVRVTGLVTPEGDFTVQAERARQKFVQHRATSVPGGGSEASPNCNHTTNQPRRVPSMPPGSTGRSSQGPAPALGDFAHVIAQKAMQRRRRAVAAGDEGREAERDRVLVGGATDDHSYTESPSRCYAVAEGVATGDGTAVVSANAAARDCSRRSRNGPSDVTSGGATTNGWPAARLRSSGADRIGDAISDSSASVAGSSTASTFDETDSVNYDLLVVLPPPPAEFSDDSSTLMNSNCSNCSLTTLAASTSIDLCSEFSATPPPPPEFDDDDSSSTCSSSYRRRPVASWTVGDVADWLETQQMGVYRDSFVDHAVDGRRLTGLGRSELIALGVTQVGHRMNLERAIKRTLMSVG